MAVDHVTTWLEEKKPGARVTYQGVGEESGVHVWEVAFPVAGHQSRVGIPTGVIEDEGLLAERLMELETQGWLDQMDDEDVWVLVAGGEIAEGPSLFE